MTWTTVATGSAQNLEAGEAVVLQPRLARLDSGQLVLVSWVGRNDVSNRCDLQYSMVDGGTLSETSHQNITQLYTQAQPSIVSTGTQVFVTYATTPANFHADEWSFFINADGTNTTPQPAMDLYGGADWCPNVARFDDGSFVMTWQSERGPGYDVYAQNLSATGAMVGGIYNASGPLASNQGTAGVEILATIPGTKSFLAGWLNRDYSGANGTPSIQLALVDSQTGARAATVAVDASALGEPDSLVIGPAGTGLFLYHHGGTLFFRTVTATATSVTLGTETSFSPFAGATWCSAETAVLANGDIGVSMVFTDGTSQSLYFAEVVPSSGAVVQAPQLLATAQLNGADPTAAFSSIVANGANVTIAFNDLGSGQVDLYTLSPGALITGTAGDDTLTGTDGVDTIDGAAGNDVLLGAAGDDVLIGGAGNDTLWGGAGLDTAKFRAAMSTYEIGLDVVGDITISHAISADGVDTLKSVEKMVFQDGQISVDRYLETRVNTNVIGNQSDPSVLSTLDGGYLVVWNSSNQDGSARGIYAQKFDSHGSSVGTEKLVNTTTIGDQYGRAVTSLPDGGYLIGWQSASQDGSGYDIYLQRFSGDGSPVGAEVRINSSTNGNQIFPSVASFSDGGYVVVWQSDVQDGSGWGIYSQRYDSGGVPVGPEYRVNTTTADYQFDPLVTVLSSDSYVVTWNSYGQDGSGSGVYKQQFTSAGVPIGGEIRVNTETFDNQYERAITALADGGYLITWFSVGQDGSGAGVYAQRFDSTGAKSGVETLINTTTLNDQYAYGVTGLPDGGFVVVWYSYGQDGSGAGVYMQRFNALGSQVGGEARVNDTSIMDQLYPAVSALSDGGFVVTWMSEAQDGDGWGIYTQRYDAYGHKNVLTGDEQSNSILWSSGEDATINAAGGNDFVRGGDGSDVLVGGTGDDTLNGAAGDDTLNGGAGIDTATYADASTAVTVNLSLAGAQNTGGAGLDTLNGIENLVGSSGRDRLTGNDADNRLDGSAGVDTLVGGLGNDTYVVDVSGETITELVGGGTDTVISAVSYTLAANLENLTLTGTANLNGTGNTYNNLIIGNAGNNILNGGTSADTLVGGAGNDTYVVDKGNDVVIEDADAGTDIVQSSVSYTLSANIERLTLTGASSVAATGNELDNTLTGNGGNNTLNGGAGSDTMSGGLGNDVYVLDVVTDVATEAAGAGTDTLQVNFSQTLGQNFENLTLLGVADLNATGNAGANVVTGNAGNNVIDGAAGADTMAGGAGNDTYYVDSAGEVVTESSGAGTDEVVSAVSFTLGSNIERLTLTGAGNLNGTGNTLANAITGTAGNNVLDGGSGNDTMTGGAGDDTYVVGSTGDVVTEAASAGTDTVLSTISYTLGSTLEHLGLIGTGNVKATGNAQSNAITGNQGNNTLDGGAGSDTLDGGLGADVLRGNSGGDTLTGGDGADAFLFDTALSAAGVDQITDFAVGVDKIRLDDDVFTAFKATVSTLVGTDQFASGAGFTTAQDATDRLIYDITTGALYYDADGVGGVGSVQIAILGATVHPGLTAGDFVIVA